MINYSTSNTFSIDTQDIYALEKECESLLVSGHYKEAIQRGELAEKYLQTLKDITDEDKWLNCMIRLSEKLSVSYHNLHVKCESDNKWDCDFLILEERYRQDSMYYILRYNTCFTPIPRSQWAARNVKLYGEYDPTPWVRLAAYSFASEGKETVFWKAAEKEHLILPGEKSTFFIAFNYYSADVVMQWKRTIGQYFLRHLSEAKVLHFLERNDIMEAIALEYAYSVGAFPEAKIIIENGYCSYLELPLLYLIRKYDSRDFFERADKLKPECFRHIQKELEIYAPYIKDDYITGEINSYIHNTVENKIRELSIRPITWTFSEMYIVLEPVKISESSKKTEPAKVHVSEKQNYQIKYLWVAFSADHHILRFLRCGFLPADADAKACRADILGQISSACCSKTSVRPSFETIQWLYGSALGEMDYSDVDKRTRSLVKQVRRFARRTSGRFSKIAANKGTDVLLLTAMSYRLAYNSQATIYHSYNRWAPVPDSCYKDWAQIYIEFITRNCSVPSQLRGEKPI